MAKKKMKPIHWLLILGLAFFIFSSGSVGPQSAYWEGKSQIRLVDVSSSNVFNPQAIIWVERNVELGEPVIYRLAQTLDTRTDSCPMTEPIYMNILYYNVPISQQANNWVDDRHLRTDPSDRLDDTIQVYAWIVTYMIENNLGSTDWSFQAFMTCGIAGTNPANSISMEYTEQSSFTISDDGTTCTATTDYYGTQCSGNRIYNIDNCGENTVWTGETCTSDEECVNLNSENAECRPVNIEVTCVDSDGGEVYSQRGVTTLSTGATQTDSCSGDTLTEYICLTQSSIGQVTEVCDFSCLNGACQDETDPDPTPEFDSRIEYFAISQSVVTLEVPPSPESDSAGNDLATISISEETQARVGARASIINDGPDDEDLHYEMAIWPKDRWDSFKASTGINPEAQALFGAWESETAWAESCGKSQSGCLGDDNCEGSWIQSGAIVGIDPGESGTIPSSANIQWYVLDIPAADSRFAGDSVGSAFSPTGEYYVIAYLFDECGGNGWSFWEKELRVNYLPGATNGTGALADGELCTLPEGWKDNVLWKDNNGACTPECASGWCDNIVWPAKDKCAAMPSGLTCEGYRTLMSKPSLTKEDLKSYSINTDDISLVTAKKIKNYYVPDVNSEICIADTQCESRNCEKASERDNADDLNMDIHEIFASALIFEGAFGKDSEIMQNGLGLCMVDDPGIWESMVSSVADAFKVEDSTAQIIIVLGGLGIFLIILKLSK